MRSKQSCFLNAPEWQDTFATTQTPAWSYQNEQAPSLRLRTKLGMYLVQLPDLMREYQASQGNLSSHVRSSVRVDDLIQRAENLFEGIQTLIVVELGPLLNREADIVYPDLIAGVQDCVAHTALMSLNGMLRTFRKTRLNNNEDESVSGGNDDVGNIRAWRQRALRAYEYVREQSISAAKPLDFGLRQIQQIDDDLVSL